MPAKVRHLSSLADCRRPIRAALVDCPMRFLVALLVWLLLVQPAAVAEKTAKSWQVHFSPNGGCTEAVVKALDNAKTSVQVQAYSFTSAPIAKALVGAHRRGVRVTVILDKSQRTDKYSSADFLRN